MGFIKTLFTGKRDELSEEEMEKFKQFHSEDDSSYQLVDEEKSNEDEINFSNKSSSQNVEQILSVIDSLSENELIKVKNKIAQMELQDSNDIEESSNFIEENSKPQNISVDDKEFNSQNNYSSKENEIDSSLEDVNGSEEFEEYVEFEDLNEEVNSNNEKEEELTKEVDNDESNENDEATILKNEELDDEDDIRVFNSNQQNNSQQTNQEVDPALFSVVHDELMELFEEGEVVLLKQKFTFPTIGEKETLAFGVYNSNLSNIKDQTHWFIQKLKQFSRLKECKMLLSEEDEKDLILEVNEDYAVLLSFKTTNKITDSFEFNTKWN